MEDEQSLTGAHTEFEKRVLDVANYEVVHFISLKRMRLEPLKLAETRGNHTMRPSVTGQACGMQRQKRLSTQARSTPCTAPRMSRAQAGRASASGDLAYIVWMQHHVRL